MNKLIAELQRLYFLPDQKWQAVFSSDAFSQDADHLTQDVVAQAFQGKTVPGLSLQGPEKTVRTMGLGFRRAGDWPVVAALFQAMQDELDLPAPAISVSGRAGFRIWFSLLEPLPIEEARHFLADLRARFLGEIPEHHLVFFPEMALAGLEGAMVMKLVPGLHPETGKWSAFIDPAMGSMFADEAGLEMAPNMDRQADLLAGFKSMQIDDFHRAAGLLSKLVSVNAGSSPALSACATEALTRSTFSPGNKHDDPVSFLLAVMNEPSLGMAERIEAAKALLPYFPRGKSG